DADPTLALQAAVDMIDAPRATPNDPALRSVVRMIYAQSRAGPPMAQEPAGGDGKSNVIALTVALADFKTPENGTPGTPGDPGPTPGGPDAPTSDPGGAVTPGDAARTLGPGDPTYEPGTPVTP